MVCVDFIGRDGMIHSVHRMIPIGLQAEKLLCQIQEGRHVVAKYLYNRPAT